MKKSLLSVLFACFVSYAALPEVSITGTVTDSAAAGQTASEQGVHTR
ncbi:MAG: hypothetical protein JW863_12720 [Chitinispirillaceae bacterium]|nr:hypothetical protein [Chitinispirillaceae bacterium]